MSDSPIAAIRARLNFHTEDEFIQAFAPLVSAGGMFLRTRQIKPVGATVRFDFSLADSQRLLFGEGVVKQVKEPSSANPNAPVGMLIKFTKLNRASKALIARIVAYKQKTENASAPASPSIGARVSPTSKSSFKRIRRSSNRMVAIPDPAQTRPAPASLIPGGFSERKAIVPPPEIRPRQESGHYPLIPSPQTPTEALAHPETQVAEDPAPHTPIQETSAYEEAHPSALQESAPAASSTNEGIAFLPLSETETSAHHQHAEAEENDDDEDDAIALPVGEGTATHDPDVIVAPLPTDPERAAEFLDPSAQVHGHQDVQDFSAVDLAIAEEDIDNALSDLFGAGGLFGDDEGDEGDGNDFAFFSAAEQDTPAAPIAAPQNTIRRTAEFQAISGIDNNSLDTPVPFTSSNPQGRGPDSVQISQIDYQFAQAAHDESPAHEAGDSFSHSQHNLDLKSQEASVEPEINIAFPSSEPTPNHEEDADQLFFDAASIPSPSHPSVPQHLHVPVADYSTTHQEEFETAQLQELFAQRESNSFDEEDGPQNPDAAPDDEHAAPDDEHAEPAPPVDVEESLPPLEVEVEESLPPLELDVEEPPEEALYVDPAATPARPATMQAAIRASQVIDAIPLPTATPPVREAAPEAVVDPETAASMIAQNTSDAHVPEQHTVALDPSSLFAQAEHDARVADARSVEENTTVAVDLSPELLAQMTQGTPPEKATTAMDVPLDLIAESSPDTVAVNIISDHDARTSAVPVSAELIAQTLNPLVSDDSSGLKIPAPNLSLDHLSSQSGSTTPITSRMSSSSLAALSTNTESKELGSLLDSLQGSAIAPPSVNADAKEIHFEITANNASIEDAKSKLKDTSEGPSLEDLLGSAREEIASEQTKSKNVLDELDDTELPPVAGSSDLFNTTPQAPSKKKKGFFSRLFKKD